MKSIRQYGEVMDRMEQDPSCKQEVMAKAARPRIAVSRRGVMAGTAVAAVLLALNIGAGGYFLHKAAEDSLAEVQTSEVTEVTEATTAADSAAEQTVTTAKAQKSAGGTTVGTTEKAAVQTRTETAASAKQNAAEKTTAAETPAAQEQPKQTTAKSAETVTPRGGKLTYSLIPADRSYETTGSNQKAPVVFHVKPGEQIKVQLMVQNDPGVSEFFVPYNMSKFDYLSVTGSPYYQITASETGLLEAVGDDNRGLYISGTEGHAKTPDFSVLAECTLIAPSNSGHYLIQEQDSNNQRGIAYDAQQSPVFCDVFGAEVIVDADDAADGTAGMLADPEQTEGLTVYIEPVTAHAGQKNVAVNVCVKGGDPYVNGGLMLGYDPALKSLLFDRSTMESAGKTEFDRIGIGLDGTLLEHAPLLRSSVAFDESILVFFNNYAGSSDGDGTEMIYNGASESDAVIREDGVLFKLYFDMPEECGRYRVFSYYATLFGEDQGNPDEAPVQHAETFIPGDITVIP